MTLRGEVQLARDVARHCFGTVPRMEQLSGFNNAVFRLHLPQGARILKLARSADGDGVRKELMLLARLAREGAAAPVVEHADPDGRVVGRPYLCMVSAGDRTVLDFARQGLASTAALYHAMGAALAHLHQIAFDETGDIRHDAIVARDLAGYLRALHGWADTLASAGMLQETEARALRARRLPTVDGFALCHGDFHAVHCVVRGERITAVVDWESAWAGNPLVDLAIAHAYLDTYSSSSLVTRFAEGYASVARIPEAFELDYLPVRMIHLLALLRAWRGQGESAWQHAVAKGRVEGVLALYRRYAARLDG